VRLIWRIMRSGSHRPSRDDVRGRYAYPRTNADYQQRERLPRPVVPLCVLLRPVVRVRAPADHSTRLPLLRQAPRLAAGRKKMMSWRNLLLDDHLLILRKRLAVLLGINEALVLQQLHYILTHYQDRVVEIDGRQ
jgi:hypothetical protein